MGDSGWDEREKANSGVSSLLQASAFPDFNRNGLPIGFTLEAK